MLILSALPENTQKKTTVAFFILILVIIIFAILQLRRGRFLANTCEKKIQN